MNVLLSVKNLTVSVEEKRILKGLSLDVNSGEVHAIMGPNGSGKSTFAQVVAGYPGYDVTGGSISFDGEDFLDLEPEERAWKGLFLAFQYPVEIPGVSLSYFLRAALNERRVAAGLEEMDAFDFLKVIKEKVALLDMDPSFINRPVNFGFSGGEKKRAEILQLAVLAPRLAILDETDSGLDIDALQAVARGVEKLKSPENAFVIVTHYQRILNYIQPDFVHVLVDGRIVRSGGKDLALEVENRGYDWIRAEMQVQGAV